MQILRYICFTLAAGAVLNAQAPAPAKAEAEKKPVATDDAAKGGGFLNDLLPVAWQKRPKLRFNVITEMTPEGRTRRVPNPQEPMYYFAPPAQKVVYGRSEQSGERPPPVEKIEAAMKKALADNGYLPIADTQRRPDVMIHITYGSNGTFTELPFEGSASASDILDVLLHDATVPTSIAFDLMDRVRFMAGDKIAMELGDAIQGEFVNMGLVGAPRNPEFDSPFQLFLKSHDDDEIDKLIETAFHSGYLVTASAYDFAGVEKKQKIPLWQTRMLVETQGVSMDEVLMPLIVNTGAFLGHETGPVVVDKRIDREGRVEIGQAKVIDENKPAPAPKPTESR